MAAAERPRAAHPGPSANRTRPLVEGGLFHGLRDAELEHALGRDLDRLSGLRIAAHASLAVHDHQLADAWEHEALLRFLGRQRGELFEDLRSLLLRELELVGNVARDLRLRHHLGHLPSFPYEGPCAGDGRGTTVPLPPACISRAPAISKDFFEPATVPPRSGAAENACIIWAAPNAVEIEVGSRIRLGRMKWGGG